MEKKYSKFLTILLVIIIIGIIGLLGYLAYDYFKSNSIDKEAGEFVQSFTDTSQELIDTNTIQTTTDNTNSYGQNTIENENTVEIEEVGTSSSSSGSSKKTYKGYNVIGTIEIPKTNVSYPVLEKTTTRTLEIAVAALYPKDAVLNSKGNVVIVGHNYRNGKFFSNNKNLSTGDKIYITGLDNKKVTYIIYKMFETDENDTSFYNRDTKGAREITLSTCTDDSSARTIIFAKADGD